jgi:hypothetical protein
LGSAVGQEIFIIVVRLQNCFFFGPERMSEKKETAVVMTGAAVVDILEEDDEFEVDSALFTKDLCS